MAFRQNGKTKLTQRRAYEAWLADNKSLLARSGLPSCVTQTRDDWAYFVLYGYHQVGNWSTPPTFQLDFKWEDLDEHQQQIVEELQARWKTFCASHPVLHRLL